MNSAERLNQILAKAGHPALNAETGARFVAYLELYRKWNQRTNLSAIRDEEGILHRHFAESILAASLLPKGIGTLLDFGSGAGFPGLPIALCQPQIAVTLADSQSKKAGFLREVVRSLGLTVEVFAGRAETLSRPFDCVTLRAVDQMERALRDASKLTRSHLFLLTTEADASRWEELLPEFLWQRLPALPLDLPTLPLLGTRPQES